MRLRLRIHRNGLPAVSTLWPIDDNIQLKNTVAQLLEQVNQIFPIETADWGLEEYTVTIGGFECLHYHELGAVCKDEDEVVIKPLQYADVRARTLLGRDQISEDGRHLFDGLPFGRPFLKGVLRPEIRIPPKKKTGLELQIEGAQELDDLQDGENSYAGALVPVMDSDDEDDEDDEDFVMDEEDEEDEEPHMIAGKGSSTVPSDSDSEVVEGNEDLPEGAANCLSGLTFAFVGHLQPITRESARSLVTRHGGKVITTPTNQTNFVVVGEDAGPKKLQIITEYNLKVISKDALFHLITTLPAKLSESAAAMKIAELDKILTSGAPRTPAQQSDSDSDESSYDEDEDTTDTSESSNISSDSDDSDASWGGCESQPKTPSTPGHVTTPSISSIETKQTTISSKRKEPSDGVTSQPDNANGAKKQKLSIPHEGDPKTKARNARRRDAARLAHLKKSGKLPKEAGLDALRQWDASNGQTSMPLAEPSGNQDVTASTARTSAYHGLNGTAGNVADTSPDTTHVQESAQQSEADTEPTSNNKAKQVAEIERKRQQLLSAIANGGVDVTDDEPPEEMSTRQLDEHPSHLSAPGTQSTTLGNGVADADADTASSKALNMIPASVARRSKLDLAGSKRLLFGSLGVRVPKTEAQKDATQKKLAARAEKNISAAKERVGIPKQTEAVVDPSAASEAAAPDEEDPDAWRSKIELTAVECSDEGVTLRTPPFPFYQRWDPQYARSKSKGRNGRKHMAKKRKGNSYEHEEVYDKYNANGEGDALDYDDPAEDDEYWEEGALLGDDEDGYGDHDAADQQLLEEAAGQMVPEDDFPALPDDITTLPSITEKVARVGDYIVYKELTCSSATHWQPVMSVRTVQLIDLTLDLEWKVKHALRDLPPKEFDEDGARIYKKFEMEGLSDDEGEGDAREAMVRWSELVEPKLLQKGPAKS